MSSVQGSTVEAVLIVGAFLLLWGLHWTRWAVVLPGITGEDGEPTLVWRYVVGVGAIVLVFLAWAALVPERLVSPWRAAAFLIGDVASAGLGTVLPRLLKSRWMVTVLEGDKAQREQAIEDLERYRDETKALYAERDRLREEDEQR